MEMDSTLYKIKTFDIVADPGFGSAAITNTMSIFPKNVIRKKKIENLFYLAKKWKDLKISGKFRLVFILIFSVPFILKFFLPPLYESLKYLLSFQVPLN